MQATTLYTYFTNPLILSGTQLIYANNDKDWTRLTLRLETAGPVAVGQVQELYPPTSGKGRLLPIGEDITITMSPSTRIYITSDTVNRVVVQIEAFPWLLQLLLGIEQIMGGVLGKAAPKPSEGPKVDIGGFGFNMLRKK